jgi:uncharacterized protein (DUF111 family)
MKILYLNPFSGISGDMFLGAMLDLGVSEAALSSGLAALGIEGLEIEVRPVVRQGVKATKVDVIAPDTEEERHLAEILPIIGNSGLPPDVTGLAGAVFQRLAYQIAGDSPVSERVISPAHKYRVQSSLPPG